MVSSTNFIHIVSLNFARFLKDRSRKWVFNEDFWVVKNCDYIYNYGDYFNRSAWRNPFRRRALYRSNYCYTVIGSHIMIFLCPLNKFSNVSIFITLAIYYKLSQTQFLFGSINVDWGFISFSWRHISYKDTVLHVRYVTVLYTISFHWKVHCNIYINWYFRILLLSCDTIIL